MTGRPRIYPPGTSASERARLADQRARAVGTRMRGFRLPREVLEDLAALREALDAPSDTAVVIEALRRLRRETQNGPGE